MAVHDALNEQGRAVEEGDVVRVAGYAVLIESDEDVDAGEWSRGHV